MTGENLERKAAGKTGDTVCVIQWFPENYSQSSVTACIYMLSTETHKCPDIHDVRVKGRHSFLK